ncbi:periodic tryptophan protein 1 [Cryptococcus neoformans Tu401-1]|nr:periodic tryptophan protein 1 [Cryptococcus neoformans var. grubii Tu401-1]
MSGTLISSLVWVPRGRAAERPKKYQLDEDEIERVGKLGGPGVLEQLKSEMAAVEDGEGMEGGDEEEDWEDENDEEINTKADNDDDDDEKMDEDKEPGKPFDPNDLSAFKMDEYDEEESKGVAMGAFANIKGLTYYRDNEEDPYITLKEDEEENEDEELALLPTDSMIISARTTSDLSSLDFHVYADVDENLYAHHDLMLPAFPLCVEWLDFSPGPDASGAAPEGAKPGSYVAVGSFDPSIEIWDADLVDGLYPRAILGQSPSLEKPEAKPLGTGKKKRKQMVQPAANADYHVQPVLSLSWTPNHRNLLLSGSADGTIKLWDLTRESPMGAMRNWDKIHGGEKVQAVDWNRSTVGGLDKVCLSAGYDRTVKVWDGRAVDEAIGVQVASDIECIRWDPWEPYSFYVSLENGLILSYDSRVLSSSKSSSRTTGSSKSSGFLTAAQPKFTLSAHDGPASALDINPHIRGCILTAGMDKTVKIWNVQDEESEGIPGRKREINLATSRDLGLGRVFAARWSPDPETPLTVAAAGSKATLQVWDVASNPGARKAFGERLRRHGRELGEIKKGGGIVAVDGGEEEESEGEE